MLPRVNLEGEAVDGAGGGSLMPGSQTILLLDGLDVTLDVLTERLRNLHLNAIRAKTADEAFALATGQAIGAVVLPSDIPGPDALALVSTLRSCATGQGMSFLAAGPEPGVDARDALREAGIRIALWEPFDDSLLRYQINRALASTAGRRPRNALRVPCSVPARARTGDREKPGRLYTLSESGLMDAKKLFFSFRITFSGSFSKRFGR